MPCLQIQNSWQVYSHASPVLMPLTLQYQCLKNSNIVTTFIETA